MSIGIWQIAIVVVLVVLLFGRGKISDLMGDVAKGIKSFKKGMKDPEKELDTEQDSNKDTNKFTILLHQSVSMVQKYFTDAK